LDSSGRLEVLRRYLRGFPKFLETRTFRMLLLIGYGRISTQNCSLVASLVSPKDDHLPSSNETPAAVSLLDNLKALAVDRIQFFALGVSHTGDRP